MERSGYFYAFTRCWASVGVFRWHSGSSAARGPRAHHLRRISTGLIISAGTEGANSVLKFLGHAKDDREAVAA